MGSRFETILELCGIGIGCYALHLFVVLVHEAGHAVVAGLVGFQNNSVRVGPFRLDRKEGFSICLRWGDLLGGKIINQFRVRPESAGEARAFGMIFAGPLFNLLFAALLDSIAPQHGIRSEVTAFLIFDSGLLGILSLIPAQRGIHETDGYKLSSILFWPERRKRLMFAFSLRARIDDLKRRCQVDSFAEFLKVIDDLIREAEDSPALKAVPGWMEMLVKLRAKTIDRQREPSGEQASVGEPA